MGMVPIPSQTFLYNYVVHNPNITNWGITFNEQSNPVPNIQYQIWYNISQTSVGIDVFGPQLLSFMRGMDEAIMSVLNDPSASISATMDVTIKDWPTVSPIFLSETIVQGLGPVFFFCCVMVVFINTLSDILEEKEQKLRQAMEVMGLKPSVYWASKYLSSAFLVLIGSLTTVALGIAFNFATFRKCDFRVLLLTFFLFGISMINFAFFLSTFFKKTQAGVYVGIFVFIIGLLFESFVFSTGFIGYVWYRPSSPDIIPKILNLLPFFNFGKLFLDISTMTAGERDLLTRTVNPGAGLSWTNIAMPVPKNLLPSYADNAVPIVPPPVQSFYWFLIDIAVYTLLTWYLDCVITDELGYKLPPLFFLTPEYWGFNTKSHNSDKEWLEKYRNTSIPTPAKMDSDVATERENALSSDFSPAVKVLHLRKDYTDFRGRIIKTAVVDTCMTFRTGELTALLGQNGAGKSSTINMLCGNTLVSDGDARIFGFSLKTQMHCIRSIMGVCPQHDILFHELTAREHIELYAGLKGVPRKEWESLIKTGLDAVKLLDVVDRPVSTYSGGMKRRLSVVIATIGDPKIIFMDEPSTGMDPVNRRHVWSFIEKIKKDRVIILTTHSMEEADVLGDRIAIMAQGRIQAIGDSMSLKTKFGAGYKISIICDPNKLGKTKELIRQNMPGAVLEDDSAGALLYQFPNSSLLYVGKLVEKLNSESFVKGWGLSQTTLEQVFLSVVRNADPTRASIVALEAKKSKFTFE